jgi:hypothetical protein
MFGSKSSQVVEHRRDALQQYLETICQLQPLPIPLQQFLGMVQQGGPPLDAGGRSSPADATKPPSCAEDFDLLKVLGKGAFGTVFLVRTKATKEIYAMKVLIKSEVRRRKQVEHTNTERRIMGSITHPFIVSLKYAFQTSEKLYMVSDFCPGGELFFHLKQKGIFPEAWVKFYAAELTAAVDHLHSLGVVYRDMKVLPRNSPTHSPTHAPTHSPTHLPTHSDPTGVHRARRAAGECASGLRGPPADHGLRSGQGRHGGPGERLRFPKHTNAMGSGPRRENLLRFARVLGTGDDHQQEDGRGLRQGSGLVGARLHDIRDADRLAPVL